MLFLNSGRSGKPVFPGFYQAFLRKVTTTIILPTNRWINNGNNHLYVWGRSGQGLQKSGFSAANPNYQLGYSEVSSGTGGNNLVPGILHDQNFNVTVFTYQYALFDEIGQYFLGYFPNVNALGTNISFFGREIIPQALSVEEEFTDHQQVDDVDIYPSPACNKINLSFKTPNITFQ